MNRVEIANSALAEIGQTRISTLEDANEGARLCKVHIKPAIKEILDQGRWKAARTPAVLTQNSTAPDFGWDYSYNLPVDYLRLVSFNEIDSCEQTQELYEVQGRVLLTDEDEVSIVYIRDLTIATNDVNVMGPLLTRACYLQLAAKLAWPLQQSRTLKESLMQDAEIALRKAKSANSGESFQPQTDPASGSRWLPARSS